MRASVGRKHNGVPGSGVPGSHQTSARPGSLHRWARCSRTRASCNFAWGGTNARHSTMIAAWRQVLTEAGGLIPRRNVERLLRTTWVRVPAHDGRRLDLIASGLSVQRGLPLFCDVTIISPISRNGAARPGTSNRGGSLLERAEDKNNVTYTEVVQSSIATLVCLGSEVYGRWGKQSAELVPKLAYERTKGLPGRIRKGATMMYQRRWWGILSVALQCAVSRMVLHPTDEGADLFTTLAERAPHLDELPLA